jgi:hypothetical protein
VEGGDDEREGKGEQGGGRALINTYGKCCSIYVSA